MKFLVGFLAAALACTSVARAATFDYSNWTSATVGLPGSASGVIHLPGHDVTVTYTGEVNFAQLNNIGTKYFTPTTTWTSATVSNAPITADMVALGNNGTGYAGINHIVFSEPVTNPILAIVSLGGPGSGSTGNLQWSFDQPYVLLSQGPSTAWGGSDTSMTQISNTILQGHEGDGTIQFVGTFSSINFTQVPGFFNEFWHSFTVGLPDAVPEPSTVVFLGVGAAGLLSRRRGRRMVRGM